MQTIKTAAIVVLMMAVIYGAYVSLTTPPEPLPEDLQGMLDFDQEGSLAIDAGLPESLGELNISSGTASDLSTPGMPVNAMIPGDAMNLSGLSSSTSPSGVSTSLSDLGPTAGRAISTAGVGIATLPSQETYPSTGDTFDMPDPSSVSLPDANLALASGTLASPNSFPNEAGVSPIATLDTTSQSHAPNTGLANAIRAADKQYAADQHKDALSTLSLFYNTPNMSGEQRSELLSRLDPLAREVIYSKQHLLEQPHRVSQRETLIEIAAQYQVPWQLLANINEIDDPVTILPGTELKVVRGPFRAEVNLTLQELTLFLGDLYAGRFPIGVGHDPSPEPGTFTVQDKQTSKTFYDSAGSPVPPSSPENPYGEIWLDLGNQICIHGSPSTTSPTNKGCISLAADYADDLYGILSQGSSVTIRR